MTQLSPDEHSVKTVVFLLSLFDTRVPSIHLHIKLPLDVGIFHLHTKHLAYYTQTQDIKKAVLAYP